MGWTCNDLDSADTAGEAISATISYDGKTGEAISATISHAIYFVVQIKEKLFEPRLVTSDGLFNVVHGKGSGWECTYLGCREEDRDVEVLLLDDVVVAIYVEV